MRCSAILVNYNCAELLLGAVRSIAEDPACDRIYVVDNASTQDEIARLQMGLPANALLIQNKDNLGFGKACNLAFELDDADFVLLLNPDARLLPGALARMIDTLKEKPSLAAVGPRVYWDDSRAFLLPPTTFPSRASYIVDSLASRHPAIGDLRSTYFRAYSVKFWHTETPISVNALSGGHVLLRRHAVEAAGGLFDPRFFMYWEDSDLMFRLRKAGYGLCMDPRAIAIHYYAHSPEKGALIARGWPAFAERHFNTTGWRMFHHLCGLIAARPKMTAHWPTLYPDKHGDLTVSVPHRLRDEWLMEISPSPFFIPSIGHFGSGETANIPGSLLQRFTGSKYYLRIGDARRILSPSSCFLFEGEVHGA